MALGNVTKICKSVDLLSNTWKEITLYDANYFSDLIYAANAGSERTCFSP